MFGEGHKNAPHFAKPWPDVLQYLCGLAEHKDRNYSDGHNHYAYCLRCGRMFGGIWGSYMKPDPIPPTEPIPGRG